MNIFIYFIIAVLFLVLTFWTWNNTKGFESDEKRIIFIVIGIIILALVTFITFNISKLGIVYPTKDIQNYVMKIAVLLFMPINGFVSLPHIAKIKVDIASKNIEQEKSKKKIKILIIIMIIFIIIQIFYLKDFQNGIISMLNNRN